jgi:hypothetical protein
VKTVRRRGNPVDLKCNTKTLDMSLFLLKEVFNGKTIWEGIVEVFDLHGHDKANIAYAWTHDSEDPDIPRRSVTVLHVPPAVSPETAVRFAIVQELRANADIEAEA